MSGAAASAMQEVFAANRARGRIALSVAALDGVSRRVAVHEEGSLRVRFPGSSGSMLEAAIVNTAGGVASGDRLDLDFKVGPGARLIVGSVAAEKVYRSEGLEAVVNVKLDVAAGGALCWLPHELILFNGARLRRRIDVDLSGDASVLIVEAVIFGRAAMGEQVSAGQFFDRWRLRRGGRLLFADGLRLDGDIAAHLAEPAVANGNTALATILMSPGGESQVAAVRALSEGFAGEAGISTWRGITSMRLCAPDGAALRQDLTMALSALGQALPRLWLN